jgi:hypothetical protein
MRFVVEELWEFPPVKWADSPLNPAQHLELHIFCRACKLGGRLVLNSETVGYKEIKEETK